MTRRKLLALALGSAVLVAALIAYVTCWRGFLPHGDDGERVLVRLKWLHQSQFAGYYVAKEKGFYKENRLDVVIEPGGVDFPAIQMVAGGGEDFGVTGADQILLAREKGVPVVALAVIYRKSPMVFFSLKDTAITTPQQFLGKRVGVKLGGNEELTYRAMMRMAGVDTTTVKEVPVKYDITPLLTRQVDVWPGYAINEPLVAKEKGHDVNIIWPSDYGVNLYADTLFTSEATLRERPDIVDRFVSATLRGWEYAFEHPDEAVQCTLKQSDNLNAEHEKRMMEASLQLLKPDGMPIGCMNRKAWLDMESLLWEHGFLKARVDVDMVFTERFLGSTCTAAPKK